jgi:peptide-methionine (S)-S-oxide reductase
MKKVAYIAYLLLFTMSFQNQAISKTIDVAVVAGGCFWCVEADFEQIPGVIEAISGYTGGVTENPTYKDVTKGGTGHYEAVEIIYDAEIISYKQLIDIFWRTIDPTDALGQFCDRGQSYQTAIFVKDASEEKIALSSKLEAQQVLNKKIVTPIIYFSKFYPAENYHQDYYKGENFVITRYGLVKQSKAYKYYRKGCGRDIRLVDLWGSKPLIAK